MAWTIGGKGPHPWPLPGDLVGNAAGVGVGEFGGNKGRRREWGQQLRPPWAQLLRQSGDPPVATGSGPKGFMGPGILCLLGEMLQPPQVWGRKG